MLTQHPRTSVAEYAEEFTRLSVYAPHLVATEEMRVKRFVRGLVNSLFRSMHPHAENISFAKAVDLAETLEERNLEHQDDRNEGKRQKTSAPVFTRPAPRPSVVAAPSVSQASVASPFTRPGVSHASMHPCNVCKKVHIGTCTGGARTCYQCGKEGHYKRECPMLKVVAGAARPQTSVAASYAPPPTGWGNGGTINAVRGRGQPGCGNACVFALTRQDAKASNAVGTGTLRVCGYYAYVLFDTGSTHSYVSPLFSVRFGRKPELLDMSFSVEVPSGEPLDVDLVFRGCEVEVMQ